jgi:hypothetical protein
MAIAAIAAPHYGDVTGRLHAPAGFPVETDSITSATGLVGVAENCRVRVNALA